ncbi:MAG: DUF4157 domain-containing protein [Cyanobacteria bacterium SID2]|nr:DUF4157 domain-containing protein [Cyanobacteria bacterium SID2]MBP0003231.1 DUF4157 domain-containing protein [Cyanobacteria bacterium SBC]
MQRYSRFAVYLSGLLSCLSAGVFIASLTSFTLRSCSSPHSTLGQLCRGEVPDRIPEAVLANLGSMAYQTLSYVMEHNHTRAQPLNDVQKAYLRPYFGDLVDRVRVVYNAQLIDNWVGANLRIDLGHSNAQVYGYRIYINESYQPDDIEQIILLAHEIVHVRQSEQLGGLDQFGYDYFLEYKRADRIYENNIFEREAFAFERHFRQRINSHQSPVTSHH